MVAILHLGRAEVRRIPEPKATLGAVSSGLAPTTDDVCGNPRPATGTAVRLAKTVSLTEPSGEALALQLNLER
jgi:hypothetical protein